MQTPLEDVQFWKQVAWHFAQRLWLAGTQPMDRSAMIMMAAFEDADMWWKVKREIGDHNVFLNLKVGDE